MTVRLDPKSWQDGYDAGLRTAPRWPMPPTPCALDSLAWVSGFVEGRATRLDFAKARP